MFFMEHPVVLARVCRTSIGESEMAPTTGNNKTFFRSKISVYFQRLYRGAQSNGRRPTPDTA